MKTLLITFATMMLFITTVAQQVPFEDTPTTLTATFEGFLVSKDVNGDGIPDFFHGGIVDYNFGTNPIYKTFMSIGDGTGNVTDSTNNTFPDLGSSDGLLDDVNNDGNCDVFIAGRNEDNELVAEIHFGDGNGNFTFNQAIVGLQNIRAKFSDLDNDGDLDLVVSGDDFNNIHTIVYRNDNGVLVEVVTILENILGDIAIFDYDNDGDNDVVSIGTDGTQIVAKLYKNNGNFDFSNVSTILVPMSNTSISVADIDNDGDLDLGTNGFTTTGPASYVYLNNGDGTFELAQELIGVYGGDIVFKDVDKDGFADTFIIGSTNQNGGKTAKLYINDKTGHMVMNRGFSPGLTTSSALIVDVDSDTNMDIVYKGNEADIPFSTPVIKMFRNTTLGVEEFTDDDLKVYPNPTNGIVNIQLPNDVFATDYSVIDMSGKKLNVSIDGTALDFSSLAQGVYILRIQSESGSAAKQIIKN